jgi:hypothetical protein
MGLAEHTVLAQVYHVTHRYDLWFPIFARWPDGPPGFFRLWLRETLTPATFSSRGGKPAENTEQKGGTDTEQKHSRHRLYSAQQFPFVQETDTVIARCRHGAGV